MTPDPVRDFDALVADALDVAIDGWHFDFMAGRVVRNPLPWSYRLLAEPLVQRSRRLLDVDTGGGELLAGLRPPRGSLAVEDWQPNVPIARDRLAPLGVEVRSRTEDALPAGDGDVDLVLNSHGDLDLAETGRVLEPGGALLTQQVGHDNEAEFADWFQRPAVDFPHAVRSLAGLRGDVTAAGFEVDVAAHAVTTTRYLDVGAVVLQLRAVPWQVPDFDAVRDEPVLRRIHEHIGRVGGFDVHSTRYLLQARRH